MRLLAFQVVGRVSLPESNKPAVNSICWNLFIYACSYIYTFRMRDLPSLTLTCTSWTRWYWRWTGRGIWTRMARNSSLKWSERRRAGAESVMGDCMSRCHEDTHWHLGWSQTQCRTFNSPPFFTFKLGYAAVYSTSTCQTSRPRTVNSLEGLPLVASISTTTAPRPTWTRTTGGWRGVCTAYQCLGK